MKKSRLPLVLFAAAIVAFPLAMPPVRGLLDGLAYPWAHPWTGKPALIGTWQGDLRIGGKSYPLTLAIERKPLKSHRRATEGRMPRRGGFTGTAEWKDSRGRTTRFDLSGRANRSASEVTLQLTATARPSSSEIQPVVHTLKGALAGTALRLRGEASYGIFENGAARYPPDTSAEVAEVSLGRS